MKINKRINNSKKIFFKIQHVAKTNAKKNLALLIAAFLIAVFVQQAEAHQETGDIYVRVVSADPASRTYTFACNADPQNNLLRDWFIRPDDGNTADDANEAEILDVSGNTITYQFKQNAFYHVACLLYNDQTAQLSRGDLHIDLRTSKTWNPQITPLSSNGLSSTLQCDYSGSKAGLNWEVVDARAGTRSNLGSANPLTHTVSGHGIYDYICNVDGKSTQMPVEYFDAGEPYFPDNKGVPNGVTSSWVRGQTTNTTNTTNNTTNTSNTTNTTKNTSTSSGTYMDVKDIPATCSGGTITSDSYNGGRQITCTNAGKSLSVSAWNKPDQGTPQYFEMYKSGETPVQNSGLKICIGNTCISDNGYAKSSNYPISFSGTGNTTNTTNTTNNTTGNTTNSTGGSGTAYNNIKDIPVSCVGGTVSSDVFNGGRQVTCTTSGKSLSVSAWNKPDSGTPQYFEVYKTGETPIDNSGLKICFGNTCVSDNGYAKSPNYPIYLSGSGGTGTNTTNTTGNTTNTTTNTTNTSVAYSSAENIPASCVGGSVISDTFDGGRKVVCSANGKTLSIAAWNKPDQGTPQYFEMYKVMEMPAGSSGLKVCLGSTCISDNGYAKSPNFPIYFSGGSNTNTSNTTNGSTATVPAPVWYSTYETDVAPNYFHIEVQEPANSSSIASADYEIWTSGMGDRAWYVHNAQGALKFHVHTPDGVFDGSYARKTQLSYGTTYTVQARYKLTNGSYTTWSQKTMVTLSQESGGGTSTWTTASGFKVETVATGLDYPVHVAAAPSGMYTSLPDNLEPAFYVTELYGKVKVVHKDGSQAVYAQDLLNFDPFGSITGGGQMGVIGLYVDDATGDLFVGMTYVEGQNTIKNKVMRFVSTNDGNSYTSSQTVINNLPSSASHQVEQITKGPDGKLYVTLGDALVSSNAQNDSILAGKIIRMNMDGSNVEVYAKGFRNPFGADWRPGYNVLYATDNAPDSGDRVVKVLQGQNYGWGLNDNFATWHNKSIFYTDVSPVDVEFNPGGKGFPSSLTGKMYVAVAGPVYTAGPTANGKVIWELTLDNNGNVASSRQFLKYAGDGYAAPMGLDFGPDGLYFTDIYGDAGATGYGSEGRLLRIVPGTPTSGGNDTGEFRTNIFVSPWYPKLQGSSVEYEFTCNPIDGSGNYKYDWYFGDGDKILDDSWNKKLHTYPYTNNQYTVTCVAKDQSTGKQANATMVINPADYIPEY